MNEVDKRRSSPVFTLIPDMPSVQSYIDDPASVEGDGGRLGVIGTEGSSRIGGGTDKMLGCPLLGLTGEPVGVFEA